MKVFFRNIHLYLSLAAGIVIFCSCLTGTILVFEEELEHVLHHDRYYAEPAKQRIPLSQLVFSAVKEVPEAKLATVKVYKGANRTVEISLIVPERKENKAERGKKKSSKSESANEQHQKNGTLKGKKPEEGGARPNVTVFVNPYTGKVTDQFNRRKSFFYTAEMLHRFLLAGKNSIGNKIVGISTLFFLFILITGLVLWWPKNKKIMRQRLRYKWFGGWKRLVHDLHIVTGFYTSLFLVVIVSTGLIMSFKWANQLLFAVIDGSKPALEQPKLPVSVYQKGIKPLLVSEILIDQDKITENAASYTIRIPKDSIAAFTVNTLANGAVETTADTYFLDQYSGKIIGIQKFSDKNTGQRARAFVKPIHTGAVYGLPTKILSFIICLLSLIFPVTGVMMWLNRNKKSKGKRSKNYAVN